MGKAKDREKVIVPVGASIELAWPLNDLSRKLDYRLTKMGLVPKTRVDLGTGSEDYTDISCVYTDPARRGMDCNIGYCRSFQGKEIQNYARFTEQDTILRNGQTYVPINILVERFKDSNFGLERIEYSTPDEQVAFDRCGGSFKVKTCLHHDTSQNLKEAISQVLRVPPGKLTKEYDEGYIHSLDFSPEETIDKILELWGLKIS
jgi:hypothetical protein